MKVEDILQLIECFDRSELTKLKYKEENTALELRKEVKTVLAQPSPATRVITNEGINVSMSEADLVAWNEGSTDAVIDSANSAEKAVENENQARELTSPLAGVFYRAPEPGKEPFVCEGMKIKKGDTIGLIEAMKVINEIPSPCDGTIVEIKVEDGAFAEFKQVLMTVMEA